MSEVKDYTLNPLIPLKFVQNEGVEFLLSHRNSIIAFQTGLGKTYTTLTACGQVLMKYPETHIIVINPKKSNGAFKKTLTEFLNTEYSLVSTGDMIENANARVHMYNSSRLGYEGVMQEIYNYATNYNCVLVVDEVHFMRSDKSKLSKQMTKLRSWFKVVWGMTATPILNNIEGAFHIINFIRPGTFSSIYAFKNSYMRFGPPRKQRRGGKTVDVRDVIGYKNITEDNREDAHIPLLADIVNSISIFRFKPYNLEFHYDVTQLDDILRDSYIEAAQGVFDDGYSEDDVKTHGARLHDLQRIVNGSHEVLPENKKLYNKEKALVKRLMDLSAKGRGAIIYTENETTYTRLEKIVKATSKHINYNKIYMITGKVSQKKREEIEKVLHPRDILIITKAGSESLNLQALGDVVFYDIPFAVETFIQVVGRVTRIDSTHSTQNVWMIEVENTIDTYKRILFEDNASLIKMFFSEGNNLPPNVSVLDRAYLTRLKHKLLWKKK